MRPEVQQLLSAKAWVALRQKEEDIQSRDDPEELGALGSAFLNTGCVWKALKAFRACRNRLQGEARAVALVHGAYALSLMGDYREALHWLDDYFCMDTRAFDGSAYECEAYCLWQLGHDWETVDAAYRRAAEALAGSPMRIAQLMVDHAQMLIQAGQIGLAEQLIEQIPQQAAIAGHVLGCRARIAEARGDLACAHELAREALAALHTATGPVAKTLREIGQLYLLLARVTSPPDSLAFIDAAKAVAMTLRFPSLYEAAIKLERTGCDQIA